MTTEILHKKTGRYLRGESTPAEIRQIQTWLSCPEDNERVITEEEKMVIESDIVFVVKAYADYTLFTPKPEPWWKKITAFL